MFRKMLISLEVLVVRKVETVETVVLIRKEYKI